MANLLRSLENEYKYSEMAILVRTNAQTRAFEERFLSLQMPYLLVGGVRFYERAEIKDLVAYLRFVRNPDDPLSFDRIVNRPPRGIGQKTKDGLITLAEEAGTSAWQVLAAGGALPGIPARGAKSLRRFHAQMAPIVEAAPDLPLPALLVFLAD